MRPKLLAYAVHAFTASGLIFSMLAVNSIAQGEFHQSLIWLFGAYMVDAIDGTLARKAKVKEVLPDFDGRMLDYVIDFLNFVFIPAYLVLKIDALPQSVEIPLVVLILLVSAYHYGNLKAVTTDHYFLGFPAAWNLVVFYIFFLSLSPIWNVCIVLFFAIMHFVPVKVVYLTRIQRYRKFHVSLTVVWALCNGYILFAHPEPIKEIMFVSLGIMFYMTFISFWVTFKTPRNPSLELS